MTHNNLSFTVCLVLLVAFSIPTDGQANKELSQRKKLTAGDFKGAPDPKSDHLATTFTLLSYQYSYRYSCADKSKQKFIFETSVRMGEKSWMKFDKIKSRQLLQELLDHEQGHYDIAEVFSLQLEKSLNNSCFDRNRYKFQIDSMYQSISKYYNTLQYQYDAETNYGQNRDVQSTWKSKIEAMVKSMMSL